MTFEIDRTFLSVIRMPAWWNGFLMRISIYGPYRSKNEASLSLKEFIKHCIDMDDDGGRTNPEQKQFSLIPRTEYAARGFVNREGHLEIWSTCSGLQT